MYRVSVIIPTYNRQDDVIQAIESAQNQTYQPYEIILVDDGSTDGTVDRLHNLADPVRYIRLSHSGLPAVARNTGIRSSTGDLIAFLDSDDRWLPDKLEQQIGILQLNPSLSMVCSNARISSPKPGRQDQYYHDPERTLAPPILLELIKDNFVITSTVLARRDGLDEAGMFSERAELCAIEDYDLWLRLAAVREIAYSPVATIIYNIQSENNLHSTKTRSQHALGMAMIYRNLQDFLNAHPTSISDLDEIITERVFHYSWLHLLDEWEHDRRTESMICAGKLIKIYKFHFFRWMWGKMLYRLSRKAKLLLQS